MELSAQGFPVIDFGSVITGDSNIEKTADQAAYAMKNFGCFYIKNHGVDMALLDDVQDDIRQFFSLTTEYKMEFAEEARSRGYVPLEGINVKEFLGQSGYPSDPLERLVFGPENGSKSNIWPTKPYSLRNNTEAIYRAFGDLAEKMTPIIGKATGLHDLTQFNETCRVGPNTMKFNYYPGNLIPKDKQWERLAEHTDASMFTILINDQKGLQVQMPDGKWLHADPVPNALFIPLGEALADMVQYEWKAPVHKVVWPDGLQQPRLSVVYFISLFRFVERGPY